MSSNSKYVSPPRGHEITRRDCITAAGAVTASVALGLPTIAANGKENGTTFPVRLRVNKRQHDLKIDPRVTLLDLVREDLGLTGSKKGCDHGQCGACTVLANGRRINSCLSLAVSHDGEDITTIEGLAENGRLHAVQAAFIEHDGFQCGYCTPGQICSAVALLAEAQRGDASYVSRDVAHVAPTELTDAEVRERMSGNICRCGAYPGIVAAVQTAGRAAPSSLRVSRL